MVTTELTPQDVDKRSTRRKPESYGRLQASARKLFIARGYHATRPQDITRDAGLGHGTFYLHFPDKRACFLAFVEDARSELDAYIRARVDRASSLETFIATMLHTIYEYIEAHPGLLNAAMTDEAVIATKTDDGEKPKSLLQRWGDDWAEIVRNAMRDAQAHNDYDANIIGQAIIGALHQTASEGASAGRSRELVIDNLTRFLVRALRP